MTWDLDHQHLHDSTHRYHSALSLMPTARNSGRFMLSRSSGGVSESSNLPRRQPSTMKASTILYWRYLVSKIHPPLPMDKRESERMLSTLKASFQQRLDRDYPRVTSEERTTIDDHIQSILVNPLFSIKPKRQIKYRNHFHGHVESLSQLRHLMRQPMDYFKDEIAAGTATLGSAKTCLTAELQKALASPKETRGQFLRYSEAGSTVLNWLWSSSGAETGFFLLDQAFMKRLMPFLDAVSHEKLIWHWMQILQKRFRNETSEIKCLQIRTMQSRILHYFLKSEILYGAGLNSAINIFLRGIVYISTWSGLSPGDINVILERAGRYLMLDMIENPALITPELWASFCHTISTWSSSPRLHSELPALHRSGSIQHALAFLTNLDTHELARLNRNQRTDMICLSLKTVELLLSQELGTKAAWVMRFLHCNFANEIGYIALDTSSEIFRKRKEQLQIQCEESSLRLLDTLAVP